MRFLASLTFLLFAATIFQGVIFSDSLNLVELQKKEAKRRKKTKKSKYVLTDSSIVKISTGGKRVSFLKAEESGENLSLKEDVKKKKDVVDPKTTKKYWERRLRISNENIIKLKEQMVKTRLEMNKAQTDYLTLSLPMQINNAKIRVDNLKKKLAELEQKLSLAELEKEKIFEDARKSNVPPGWLR